MVSLKTFLVSVFRKEYVEITIDLSGDRVSSIKLSPSTSCRCFTHPTSNYYETVKT